VVQWSKACGPRPRADLAIVAACCRHHLVSGRALCTRTAPHTLHTGCGLALAPALARCRVAKAIWPVPAPYRRERGKRWSHSPIEGPGKPNLADPPPILDRPAPTRRPFDRGPRKYQGQFLVGYMKVKLSTWVASAVDTSGLVPAPAVVRRPVGCCR
jgi:hypothetical protein